MQTSPALPRRARYLRDVVAGSDPGLTRLRSAASAALAMATGLAALLLVSDIRGADPTARMVAMLLGAIVAMMGSMALVGSAPREQVRIAAGFPVAMGLGMVVGVAVAGHTPVMLTGFAAVMFIAVYVRRFGVPYFFYGFMLWMGYFFASFLHATWSALPWQVLDTVIATVWVLFLSLTVMRASPRRTLVHVRQSFGARGRRIAATVAALLDPDRDVGRARLLRRLTSLQTQLAEAALIIEAWSAQKGALPPGWTPQALRRRILDAQLALDGIALAGADLVPAPDDVRRAAAAVTGELSMAHYDSAESLVGELEVLAARASASSGSGAAYAGPARRLASSVRSYVAIVRRTGDDQPPVDMGEFIPAVALAMGDLPGSVAVASSVEVRGGPWNVLSRLDFTTRQAVQVAVAGGLAILLGRELSETRYYWAVIAAFIAFTGTGSRAETFIKSGNRVLGTLVGLVFGIELAHLTSGHLAWCLVVIVAAMFFGFYLVRINYAYMIFFVTIMVSQLYSVLNEFSDKLLFLRLEETVIGAFCGIVVGLLVAPLSTRETAKVAQHDLLEALAVLLRAVAGCAADPSGASDGFVRDVDNRLRRLTLVAAPLTRPLVVGNSPAMVRHRLTLYAGATQAAHSLAAGMRFSMRGTDVDRACIGLAALLDGLAQNPPMLGSPTAGADPDLLRSLRAWDVPSGRHSAGATRSLDRLHEILCELFLPTARG